MGKNAHGVSPNKIRNPLHKTKKRLAAKAARKAAQGVKGKRK